MFHLTLSKVSVRHKSIAPVYPFASILQEFVTYDGVASRWPRQEVEVLRNRPSISTPKLSGVTNFSSRKIGFAGDGIKYRRKSVSHS